MSTIVVHIERLVVDGMNGPPLDAAALRAAMSTAIAKSLTQRPDPARDARRGWKTTIANLVAPDVATGRGSGLGSRAGDSIATAIHPLCGLGRRGPGGSRRG